MDVNVDLGDETETVSVDSGEDEMTRKAPKEAHAKRYEINTGYGDLLVTISFDEQGPVELIANIGNSGGQVQSMTEAIGKLCSESLQNGVPPERIIHQLEGIKSPKKSWDNGVGVNSVPDGIALALKRFLDDDTMNHMTVVPENYEEEQKAKNDSTTKNISQTDRDECPECHSMTMVYEEGCSTCKPELGGCGYSKCG